MHIALCRKLEILSMFWLLRNSCPYFSILRHSASSRWRNGVVNPSIISIHSAQPLFRFHFSSTCDHMAGRSKFPVQYPSPKHCEILRREYRRFKGARCFVLPRLCPQGYRPAVRTPSHHSLCVHFPLKIPASVIPNSCCPWLCTRTGSDNNFVFFGSKFIDTSQQPSRAEIVRMAMEICSPLVIPHGPNSMRIRHSPTSSRKL